MDHHAGRYMSEVHGAPRATIWSTNIGKRKNFFYKKTFFPKLYHCNFLITLRGPRRRAVESALVDNYC